MKIHELNESIDDLDKMAIRKFMRDIASNRPAVIPQIFRHSTFYPLKSRSECVIYSLLADGQLGLVWECSINAVNQNEISLCSRNQYGNERLLQKEFGISVNDLSVASKSVLWPMGQGIGYMVSSESFVRYFSNLMSRWAPFICYPDGLQSQRLDYLSVMAGEPFDINRMMRKYKPRDV